MVLLRATRPRASKVERRFGCDNGDMNSASAIPVFHDSIASRAYELFERRGATHGHELDDWLQAERELAGKRTYRVGILIIGSLIWDRGRTHREAWRTERLTTERIVVRAPIRYGRRSKDRKNTYTMLFSNEFCQDHMGSAVAVPRGRRIRSGSDLVQEAEALWAAEQTTPGETRHPRWERCIALYSAI
jgi:hypothetical protein